MDTRRRGMNTEMQVTSIRLEAELKERLRELSGQQGYQSLIREVLWQFVEQQTMSDRVRSPGAEHERFSVAGATPTPSETRLLSRSEIRVIVRAVAQQEERCAMTAQVIPPQQLMWLGLTIAGELVPLSTRTVV